MSFFPRVTTASIAGYDVQDQTKYVAFNGGGDHSLSLSYLKYMP